MTSFRADPTLELPPSPRSVPVVGPHDGPLAQAGTAGNRPFLLEQGPIRLVGSERDGLAQVHVNGRRLVDGFRSSAGTAANLVTTPGGLRREVIGAAGVVQETVLAVDAPACAVVQWHRPGGSPDDPFTLELSMRLGGAGAPGRYHAGEHALVLQPDDDSPATRLVVSPAPEAWKVEPDADDALGVTIRATSTGTTTLVVASGGRPAAAVRAAESLTTHARRALGATQTSELVSTSTGVAELDDGVAWLAWRLAHGQAQASEDPIRLLWWGLGALAVGAADAAQRALEHLEESAPDEAAFLAARVALTTGRQDVARKHVDLRPGSALGVAAAHELADALRYAATDDEIDALRSAPPPEPPHQRVLPMVGAPAPPTDAVLPPWLMALLEATRHRPHAGAPLADVAQLLVSAALGQPEAYGGWRGRLADGLSGGPAGRGSWDPADACPAQAGALACCLLHGVLGWFPDAPVGRMGLSPRLPAHYTAFAVQGLPMGDVRVDLTYQRDSGGQRYVLAPTSGRVPPTVVFTANTVGGQGTVASLDGDAVELDVKKTRDGGAVSLQIPLDGPRTFVLSDGEAGRK